MSWQTGILAINKRQLLSGDQGINNAYERSTYIILSFRKQVEDVREAEKQGSKSRLLADDEIKRQATWQKMR